MESQKRHARSKSSSIFSFLKSTSFSLPGLDAKPRASRPSFNHRAAFSGPIVSIVPAEARRPGSSSLPGGYRTPEPSSPKVSCIGQIKLKKKKLASASKPCKNRPPKPEPGRAFWRRARSGRGEADARPPAVAPAPAPALGQMKRFASGREALRGFQWKEAEEAGVEEALVGHSAPLVLGGGAVAPEPRKEVNLWRRRPMAPPSPLRVH